MWVLYGLMAAVFSALMRMANHHYKKPGMHLAVFSKIFCVLLLIPVSFFVSWPSSPWFYAFAFLQAPLIVYCDSSMHRLVAKYGAGPFARLETFMVPLLFVSWLFISPSELQRNLNQPIIFVSICACIAVMTGLVFRLFRCEANGEIVRAMLPVLIAACVITLFAKGAADLMQTPDSIVVFFMMQSFFVVSFGLATLINQKRKKKMPKIEKQTIVLSFFLALIVFCIGFGRLASLRLAPNPGYVTALLITSPVWVAFFQKLLGKKETTPAKEGALLVLFAFTLSLLASL